MAESGRECPRPAGRGSDISARRTFTCLHPRESGAHVEPNTYEVDFGSLASGYRAEQRSDGRSVTGNAPLAVTCRSGGAWVRLQENRVPIPTFPQYSQVSFHLIFKEDEVHHERQAS